MISCVTKLCELSLAPGADQIVVTVVADERCAAVAQGVLSTGVGAAFAHQVPISLGEQRGGKHTCHSQVEEGFIVLHCGNYFTLQLMLVSEDRETCSAGSVTAVNPWTTFSCSVCEWIYVWTPADCVTLWSPDTRCDKFFQKKSFRKGTLIVKLIWKFLWLVPWIQGSGRVICFSLNL